LTSGSCSGEDRGLLSVRRVDRDNSVSRQGTLQVPKGSKKSHNQIDGASATIGGPGFTGREWDAETGLYYYRARYYDPRLGRFISQDPIGLVGGVNLHAYVGNRPTVLTDPSGLQPRQLPVPPGPGPGDDEFCWNRYLRCRGEVETNALMFAAVCVAACVLLLRSAPPVMIGCIMGCLAVAGMMQIRGERVCREQYWECVTRHPQRRPPIACFGGAPGQRT
jgi:RHS repeat-associated protein